MGHNADVLGVIFDLDGTLVDSALDFEAMRRELSLPPGTPLLEHIEQSTDPEYRLRCLEVIHRHEMQGAANATWIPGAREFIDGLQQKGIPMGIVTRNMRQAVDLTVERLGISISKILTREDCAPKPDPEGLLRLASSWKLTAAQVVYVGDFVFDVDAARNAGMKSWLRVGETLPSYSSRADLCFREYEELSHRFFPDLVTS